METTENTKMPGNSFHSITLFQQKANVLFDINEIKNAAFTSKNRVISATVLQQKLLLHGNNGWLLTLVQWFSFCARDKVDGCHCSQKSPHLTETIALKK